MRLPEWCSGKESACEAEDVGDVNVEIPSLGWEDPLEDSMTTHSSILAWRIPWQRNLAGYSPYGHSESDTTEATEYTCNLLIPIKCRESRGYSVLHNYYNNGTIHVCVFIH